MNANDVPAITPGSRWVHAFHTRSPLGVPSDAVVYVVTATADGWVRYDGGIGVDDASEADFRVSFAPAPENHPRQSVPRGELEAALRDMLDTHYTFRWNVDDMARQRATQRAMKALGLQA